MATTVSRTTLTAALRSPEVVRAFEQVLQQSAAGAALARRVLGSGRATLAAGVAVVPLPGVSDTTALIVTPTTAAALHVSAVVPGESFTVASANPADVATFSWLALEAPQ